MSDYPKALHHPHIAGVVATVGNDAQEKAWRKAGWLVGEPKNAVEPGTRVTEAKPEKTEKTDK